MQASIRAGRCAHCAQAAFRRSLPGLVFRNASSAAARVAADTPAEASSSASSPWFSSPVAASRPTTAPPPPGAPPGWSRVPNRLPAYSVDLPSEWQDAYRVWSKPFLLRLDEQPGISLREWTLPHLLFVPSRLPPLPELSEAGRDSVASITSITEQYRRKRFVIAGRRLIGVAALGVADPEAAEPPQVTLQLFSWLALHYGLPVRIGGNLQASQNAYSNAFQLWVAKASQSSVEDRTKVAEWLRVLFGPSNWLSASRESSHLTWERENALYDQSEHSDYMRQPAHGSQVQDWAPSTPYTPPGWPHAFPPHDEASLPWCRAFDIWRDSLIPRIDPTFDVYSWNLETFLFLPRRLPPPLDVDPLRLYELTSHDDNDGYNLFRTVGLEAIREMVGQEWRPGAMPLRLRSMETAAFLALHYDLSRLLRVQVGSSQLAAAGLFAVYVGAAIAIGPGKETTAEWLGKIFRPEVWVRVPFGAGPLVQSSTWRIEAEHSIHGAAQPAPSDTELPADLSQDADGIEPTPIAPPTFSAVLGKLGKMYGQEENVSFPPSTLLAVAPVAQPDPHSVIDPPPSVPSSPAPTSDPQSRTTPIAADPTPTDLDSTPAAPAPHQHPMPTAAPRPLSRTGGRRTLKPSSRRAMLPVINTRSPLEPHSSPTAAHAPPSAPPGWHSPPKRFPWPLRDGPDRDGWLQLYAEWPHLRTLDALPGLRLATWNPIHLTFDPARLPRLIPIASPTLRAAAVRSRDQGNWNSLAMLGDKVIGMAQILRHHQAGRSTKVMHDTHQIMASNNVLSYLALHYGLLDRQTSILTPKHSYGGTTFEAWIGAAYMDHTQRGRGQAVIDWIKHVFRPDAWPGISAIIGDEELLSGARQSSSPQDREHSYEGLAPSERKLLENLLVEVKELKEASKPDPPTPAKRGLKAWLRGLLD